MHAFGAWSRHGSRNSSRNRSRNWRRFHSVLGLAVPALLAAVLAGCSSTNQQGPSDPAGEPAATARPLEDSWGPGDIVALATGTVASKKRNLAFNVPLISWYIRNDDYKGFALIGGILAFDMVTSERSEGQLVAKEHKSAGPLWLFGKWEKQYHDGSGSYCMHHWFFPFYRYQNVNGERTVYPLFVFPMSLASEKPPLVATEARELYPDEPIDPIDDSIAAPARGPETLTMRSAPYEGEATPKSSMDSMSDWLEDQRADAPAAETASLAARPRAGAKDSALRPVPGGSKRPPAAASTTAKPPAAAPPAAASATYTVQKGDTLFGIAKKQYGSGSAWKSIHDANRDAIPNPDRLREGIVLRLPPK